MSEPDVTTPEGRAALIALCEAAGVKPMQPGSSHAQRLADIVFVDAARTALPAALREVERLDTECANLGSVVDKFRIALAAAEARADAAERALVEVNAETVLVLEQQDRDNAALRAQLAEAAADMACICGCAEHESYGGDGESCADDSHECIMAPVSVGEMLRALRAQNEAMREALEAVQRLYSQDGNFATDAQRVWADVRAALAPKPEGGE